MSSRQRRHDHRAMRQVAQQCKGYTDQQLRALAAIPKDREQMARVLRDSDGILRHYPEGKIPDALRLEANRLREALAEVPA